VTDPETRRRWREKARRLAAANPGRAEENGRRWRAANPEKVREYSRRYRAANPEKTRAERLRGTSAALRGKKAQLLALKLTLRCADCGWQPTDAAEAAALHFDHIDPMAKDPAVVGAGAFKMAWKWPRILAEIAKCQPRCARCHAIHSYRERHYGTGYRREHAGPENEDAQQSSLW
jgi:hypothetical protein